MQKKAGSQRCNNQHLSFDQYGFIWLKKNEEKGKISLLEASMKRISYYGRSYTVVLVVYDRRNFESESMLLYKNNDLIAPSRFGILIARQKYSFSV